MNYKTLEIGNDLRENILYHNTTLPLSICIDHFDDYFGREWNCHWHEEFEFAIILSGCVQFTIYDGTEAAPQTVLHKGDGIFISAGTFHSAKALEPQTTMAVAVFPMNFFDIKPFDKLYTQNVSPITDSGITHLCLKQANEADTSLLETILELGKIEDTEICYELHCIELVCKMWRLLTIRISVSAEPTKTDLRNVLQGQRVQKMMSYIHSHYAEHISIDDIANAASVSRTECFRCFRNILKKPPVEYLLEYRLTMAATLLANTNISLSEIASMCGFTSSSYFGKMFLKQCGLSPKKYRNKCLSHDSFK